MNRGKKILITALAAALLLSMSGCGGKTSSGDTSKDKKQKSELNNILFVLKYFKVVMRYNLIKWTRYV